MTITPRDVALLIDRLQVLVGRPSAVREEHTLSITSEVATEALREFIEETRGLTEPAPQQSPIPRTPRRLDD